jgi:predicted aspartyl protease
MTTVLRDAPPLRVHGPGRAALTWNFAGSLSAEVTVRGMTQPWIIDTGAQISTIPQSTATALGVRLMPGAIGVGTSTKPIQGQVGIIDRLRIGGATAENVPVLVLPDAMLTVDLGKGGGTPRPQLIAGILGLPVFTAFRRIAFSAGLSQLQLGDAAPIPDAAAAPIYWREDGIGIPVTLGGAKTGFLLDTGANLTDLGPAGAEMISPAEQAAAVDKQIHVGGAGGVVIRRLRSWPTLSISLAGIPVQLYGISLDPSQRGAGRLGMDALRSLGAVVLDFEHMRLSAGEPKEETRWPPGA